VLWARRKHGGTGTVYGQAVAPSNEVPQAVD
jgi:hypothetical protein